MSVREGDVGGQLDPCHAAAAHGSDFPWYAVQTMARHEKAVSRCLRAEGLEEYLPLYKVEREWSDRLKSLELPLMRGYLFCRMEAGQLRSVLRVPGVVHVLGYGSGPVSVPESEVLAIRRLLASGVAAWPCPYLDGWSGSRAHAGWCCRCICYSAAWRWRWTRR